VLLGKGVIKGFDERGALRLPRTASRPSTPCPALGPWATLAFLNRSANKGDAPGAEGDEAAPGEEVEGTPPVERKFRIIRRMSSGVRCEGGAPREGLGRGRFVGIRGGEGDAGDVWRLSLMSWKAEDAGFRGAPGFGEEEEDGDWAASGSFAGGGGGRNGG